MNAQEFIDRIRSGDVSDEEELARAAIEEAPGLIDDLLAWAERARNEEVAVEGVDPDAFRAAFEVVDDPAIKGRLRLIQAELLLATGDSDQSVLEKAIDSIGWNPDLTGGYELTFDKLRGSTDLDWAEAFEKVEGRGGVPADALAMLRHVIERGEAGAREGSLPYFLQLAPQEGATLADVSAQIARGELAEAVAARRGAAGEDFPTARRAIFGA